MKKKIVMTMTVAALAVATMASSGISTVYAEEISTNDTEEALTTYQTSAGIYVANLDANGLVAGMSSNLVKSNVEYRWLYYDEANGTWGIAQNWTAGNEWLNWKPAKYGKYVMQSEARDISNKATYATARTEINYHPHIKGKCQMPYTGEGGGFLIGVESYDNPNQSYQYEMLILDCTLLAQGKDAWTYTTGKCSVPENAFWTIWQPQYGYYWTLFRVYDANGNMIDEDCYGFKNTGEPDDSNGTQSTSIPDVPPVPSSLNTPSQDEPETPNGPSCENGFHTWENHYATREEVVEQAWDEPTYTDYTIPTCLIFDLDYSKEVDNALLTPDIVAFNQLLDEGCIIDCEAHVANMSDEEKAIVNQTIDKYWPQYKDESMVEKYREYMIGGQEKAYLIPGKPREYWNPINTNGVMTIQSGTIHHKTKVKIETYIDGQYCTKCGKYHDITKGEVVKTEYEYRD